MTTAKGFVSALSDQFRPQLQERRARLQAARSSVPAAYIDGLIAEFDSALQRTQDGTYGVCEICRDAIDADRLQQDPLLRCCLDHLSEAEFDAYRQDLELANEILLRLLPPRSFALRNWDTHFRHTPRAALGGDYCELIVYDNEALFFVVGDVAGKEVAASLLMTHLSAIFRGLLSQGLSLVDVVSRANRLFCASTLPSHYARLACGRTTPEGMEICNAGYCAPVLLRQTAIERFESTGLPLGLIPNAIYSFRSVRLEDTESLVLFSDGITEAQNPAGQAYGEARLERALRRHVERDVGAMAEGVMRDHTRFRNAHPLSDDMTLLIVRRRGALARLGPFYDQSAEIYHARSMPNQERQN